MLSLLVVHVPAYPASLHVHLVLLLLLSVVLFLLRLHLHVFPAQLLKLLGQLLLPLLLPRLLLLVVELVEVDPAQVELHEVLEVLLGQSGGVVGVTVGVVVGLPRRIRTARGGSTGLGLEVNLISTYGLISDNARLILVMLNSAL